MTVAFLLSTRHEALGVPLVFWGGGALALTVVLSVLACRAATRARTVFLLCALLMGLGLAVAALGAVGQHQHRARGPGIVAMAAPGEERLRLAEEVELAAQGRLASGGLLGLLPFCVGVALVGQGLVRLRRYGASPLPE
jgi:hypothetical protein